MLRKSPVIPQAPKFNDPSLFNLSELVAHRDEITRRIEQIAPLELKDLSVERELVLQFHALRSLQADVIDDDEVPANQKAQVANSLTSTLNKLADIQANIWTSERLKSIENALIRALSKLPEQVAADFLTEYESIVTKAK